MAKKRTRRKDPAPFWWTARNCYYIQLGGKQHKLDPDLITAKKLARKLLDAFEENQGTQVVAQLPQTDGLLVAEVLDKFMTWLEVHRAPATYKAYEGRLSNFTTSLQKHGDITLALDDLKPYHCTRVVTEHPEWSENYRGDFLRAIERAINWAVDEGVVEKNPVAGMKKPGRKAREFFVTPDEFEKLLGAIKHKPFRDLIELAWETGLRVQELRKMQAKYVDFDRKTIVFTVEDSKGRKRNRIAFIGTDRAAEILKEWSAKYPEGPMLRNGSGEAWNKNAINSAFVRLQEKLGKKYHLGALRKSFATEALKNGVDAVTVAHLMGHSDTTMIARFYGHVHQDAEHMARAARKARGQD